MLRLPLLLLALLPLVACTWVALDEPAQKVLVLPAERLTADCESLNTVKVSVAAGVGVLERHDEEVIEDLNVLARNHAAQRGGDTVVARGPVVEGVREYEVFRCMPEGATTSPENRNTEPERKVEVLPYDGGSDN